MFRIPSLLSVAAVVVLSILAMGVSARSVHAQGPRDETESGPKLYQSRNFQLFTDLPKEEAEELIKRLEVMLKHVSGYWGRPNRKSIRMFVVEDMKNWGPADLGKMDASGLSSIRAGGGLTITQTKSIVGGPTVDADAIVYAVSKHGTPQHEAVHAYCGINYGSTGPVWYSEGMAEVGKNWVEGEKGVTAKPYVLKFLKSGDPKPLRDIVDNPLETTGDSWQNYSWRWAVCHLLGFNKNYTSRFKPLGLGMMTKKRMNFDSAYGNQFDEIEFEYNLFIQDVEVGYRCDLCSWDWKTRFLPLTGSKRLTAKVKAGNGWQVSRALVEEGETYAIEADGAWKLSKDGESITAEGDDDGNGQLIGVIFSDYELSEPFALGGEETFTAPASGKLYVRCKDNWGEIADNKGTVTLKLKKQPSVKPDAVD